MAGKLGLVHLYHGDGKGKTTAAMGLALRAAGRGYPVLIVQFLKRGDSGEIRALEQLGIRTLAYPQLPGFSFRMTAEQKKSCLIAHMGNLERARAYCAAAPEGLLVLDEAVGACRKGLLEEQALLHFLKNRPRGWEVVLTGRDPSAALLQAADYVTQMKKEKHPFDLGVPARDGVER
ncbi:MAG: cob(I)yrinic acid a,c-diamide adenosyltransferase [Oscillospiraceae bacterium]|nr:cob(I)yrinic acid a,c-diamide adenosyltransferase [Oscillospiraceae bacterium]